MHDVRKNVLKKNSGLNRHKTHTNHTIPLSDSHGMPKQIPIVSHRELDPSRAPTPHLAPLMESEKWLIPGDREVPGVIEKGPWP